MASEAEKQAAFEEKIARLIHAWQVLGEFARRLDESASGSGTLDAKWPDVYRGLLDAILDGDLRVAGIDANGRCRLVRASTPAAMRQ
jgi:hypothetical protein